MSIVLDGIAASEGIVSGPIFELAWQVPTVPHSTVPPDQARKEIARFAAARAWAKESLRTLRDRTEERVGEVEARIFDPQILMLDDPQVVDGTVLYIAQNRLSAERAFQWRMLELQNLWSRKDHPMILDRLNDLQDVMSRVLGKLLGRRDLAEVASPESEGVVVLARNLSPSLVVAWRPGVVSGIVTEQGTRSAHWVMLARSLAIPAVVGVPDAVRRSRSSREAVVDGRAGRVVFDPDKVQRNSFIARRDRLRAWEGEIEAIAGLESVTRDGQHVELRANLDLPDDAGPAREHGGVGVGLFRTEFLAVGRSVMPGEEEQFRAYRAVARVFSNQVVCIRTFDLGGDKFPMFLHMPQEENPFLGWRAIRVCLDEPELFRPQLRAILRATVHGDVRPMLPFVNEIEEILRVREMLKEEEERLDAEGIPYNRGYKLGVMIETPAAALETAHLASHADFFSLGTNDLVQYTLAVDRTNTRLTHRYEPFHPAVLSQLQLVARAGRAAGIEVSVCGELAQNPLGAFLLLGLDIFTLSMAWPYLPEIKKFIRDIDITTARSTARQALKAPTAREVVRTLADGIGSAADLSLFMHRDQSSSNLSL
ncbi:MAG: phosphoenolpyruvate--protein phosphotransferase [Gemmatimonadetes bacterium]|nr:phosphoenolpyruvate--protein phosphotransferase [Gemmatimonadota bacterium]